MLRRLFYLSLAASVAVLTGCGGGGGGGIAALPDPLPPEPAPTGLLVPTVNGDALVGAFRRNLAPSLTGTTDGDVVTSPDFAAPPTLELGGGAFSTTYRLEADVDEHDVVKYNGDLLFIAPTRGGACCFAVEPFAELDALLPPPPPQGPRSIRILATDPASATAEAMGTIDLAPDQTVEGLYVDDETLTAISSTAWWGLHGDTFESFLAWEAQTVGVELFDVSNPANATRRWNLSLEGALVTTRMVGDRLYMVTRHYPEIPELDYFSTDEETLASNQAILDGLEAADLLPELRIDGEVVEGGVSADSCLVVDPEDPLAPESPGYPVFTTMLVIDIGTLTLEDTVCYAEPVDGVYVSSGAIYLAQTVYDNPDAVDSIVHRFDMGDALSYRGSGRVGGSLIGRAQADFRMSEQNDVLRLVTTRWRNDEADAFDHRLYTLAPSADEPALELLAQLPQAEDDPPIGKPNEDLFGVRFLGDRAYLVTFERIDPLYVIDLSDPEMPAILGELEVSGFSDLLHPVSEDLLLGLGDDGEGKIKLELFDVSDPTAPRSRTAIVLAANASWSWTEARYDRRAFTYLPSSDVPDRLTVPVSLGLETLEGYSQYERLYMVEVRGKANADSASLEVVGQLDATPGAYIEARPRAVIDGNGVFFILGEQVWSGFWGDVGNALGPF